MRSGLWMVWLVCLGACAAVPGGGEARSEATAGAAGQAGADAAEGPNILFVFADDWGYHASLFETPGLATPHFDRVAERGVRFDRAFVDVPTCTPIRGAVLTGQHAWRLGPGASLWGTLPAELPVYPDLLEEAGYFVGYSGKGWGPGNVEAGGRERNPAGPAFEDFAAFLEQRPEGQPFMFNFFTHHPHRSHWEESLREQEGIDPAEVEVPPYLPDAEAVRGDIADYYAEVQRFDRELGDLLALLEEAGELEQTMIAVTSDHGWAFPRAKSTLYDAGTRVPMAIWWPGRMGEERGGRVVTDLVLLSDLAPTFLEAAGVGQPEQMTGRSLMDILLSDRQGRVSGHRSFVLLAKEGHHRLCRLDEEGQISNHGYPTRAIRTEDYLYIRNYEPDRWPLGSPYVSSSQWIFSDAMDTPTKRYMIEQAMDAEVNPLFLQAFDKRPAEELYDVQADPYQLHNLADDAEHEALRKHLAGMLDEELRALEDPRAFGEGQAFDEYPYYVDYGAEIVDPPASVKEALGLD